MATCYRIQKTAYEHNIVLLYRLTTMTTMTKKKKIWLSIGCIVAASIIYVATQAIRLAINVPVAYAAWATADLIVFHMETHSNQWPHSWSELLSNTNKFIAEHGGLKYGNPAELPDMISVQWYVDPEQLAAYPSNRTTRPFSVVSKGNGKPFWMVWACAEPNQIILDYLKKSEQTDGAVTQEFAPSATP